MLPGTFLVSIRFRRGAGRIRELGVKPELEIFDSVHLNFALQMIGEGLIEEPPLFQPCFGIPSGAPAEVGVMKSWVELLPGGAGTSPVSIDRAMEFYRDLGMHPLRVRTEIEGFLSDRPQEALWRELLHLVDDGVATTEELDAAIVYGPGLRWAFKRFDTGAGRTLAENEKRRQRARRRNGQTS